MADFVVVGGVPIKVSPSSGKADWNDAVDRRRSFDNTYRASATGGAARDWHFSTPPITRAVAGTYRAVLSQVQAQMCSGEGLELPTMCCAELIGETPVKGAASNYVSLDFALHESQSKRLLLKYAPGDTITGESFTRSTTAYQQDGSVLSSIAINTKRDSHYVGGVRSLILEDTRTNSLIQSSDLTQATWTKTRSSALKNAVGPDGVSNSASTVTEDATASALHYFNHATIAVTSLAPQTVSGFFKANGRTRFQLEFGVGGSTLVLEVNLTAGTVTPIANAGAAVLNSGIVSLGNGWYRVWISGTFVAGTVSSLFIYLENAAGATTYNGDAVSGILVYGMQQEVDKPFPSSFIATTTVAVTRGADAYSLPFTEPPKEMTVYAKFAEGGTAQVSKYIYQISNAADGQPQTEIFGAGGFYTAYHGNSVASVTSQLAAAPALGNTVELVARLFGDGSVDITQSINGGVATSGPQSAANALAAAWAGQLLWLNSATAAAGIGFTALQSFKIVSGSRSLAEMRAA